MPRPLALATASLAATASLLLAPTADAAVTIPVSCVAGEVVLTADDTHYELVGACGTVVVEADRSTVTMSTATHLYVTGADTEVTAKPQGLVEISGVNSVVSMASATSLSLMGGGSKASVAGLVEQVRIEATGASLTADRTHVLVVRGSGNVVDGGQGFRTRVIGDSNSVTHDLLERLRVRGDANVVSVASGRTSCKVVGTGNTVAVLAARRG
ncbi:MAG: hypothetical protein JWN68_238 [Nocardioides sp.]|jgi:hypothetical protein|uniref:hypothetical protein n=1 Tax=Nocardioides sp. TaxID=35761 RepID=UPI002636AEE8|nr:hypothetical protein [Nocardioides sp.]MCW2832285.1 hypothetical protein [Nocardioides sp.]